MSTLVFIAWSIGALMSWPLIAKWLVKLVVTSNKPDAGDYAMGIALGLCLAPFWPLIIAGMFVYTKIRSE